MNKLGDALTKHRNLFLLALLAVTLVISGAANRQRLQGTATVDIPVVETAAKQGSALDSYRQQRDQEALRDIAALEALLRQEALDPDTQEGAAAQLREIIANRQAQTALEGALVGSSLAPCVAVVSGGSTTIVTRKATVTDQDTALVLSLAAAHAGVLPENVRIITTK